MHDPEDEIEEAQEHAGDDADDVSGAGYGNHATGEVNEE